MKTPSYSTSLLSAIALLSAITVLGLCGCVSTGKPFDSSKISQIKKGETTEQELIELFGSPRSRTTAVTDSRVSSVLTWQYVEANIDGKVFIPVVGGMMSGGQSRAKTLTVVLNAEGKVDTFTYTGGSHTDTGTVIGNQKK